MGNRLEENLCSLEPSPSGDSAVCRGVSPPLLREGGAREEQKGKVREKMPVVTSGVAFVGFEPRRPC